MDPQAAASVLVRSRFPEATALLSASVASGTATFTSDLDMVATGVVIADAGSADALVHQARAHVEQGPPPRTEQLIEAQRYHLTAAVDDLLGCTDADERAFIVGQVIEMTSQLALANRDAWSGSGKWLYRWLESADSDLAGRLTGGWRAAVSSADLAALTHVVTEVLNDAGGPLQEGYRLG